MYVSKEVSINQLKSEFRNYKLKILEKNNDYFGCFLRIDSHTSIQLEFISQTFPNDVITGSFALRLLGLLWRKNNDIDILIADKHRYNSYVLDDRYDSEFSCERRLGYKKFTHKKNIFSKSYSFDVDFFENQNPNFISCNYSNKNYKIHNPFEIINYKLRILENSKDRDNFNKHKEDLINIFRYADFK